MNNKDVSMFSKEELAILKNFCKEAAKDTKKIQQQ